MYTWEEVFTRRISTARKKEVNAAYKIHFLQIIGLTINGLTTSWAIYVLLMTYAWLGNSVTPAIAYFILICFQLVSESVNYLLPCAIYQLGEITASSERIEQCINAAEVKSDKQETNNKSKLKLENVTVAINNQNILQNVNLEFDRGLTLITGPLGCGKSFLLRTILQDCQPIEGNLVVQGDISFAPQEPWLFPSSIRQNILFGEEYDQKRYQEVLRVSALIYDLQSLEAGDLTIVKDRGMNLSKGQQARINLARAIYRNREIYLLDDCLASLDARVSAFVFKECIKTFLKDKLVILVSNNSELIENEDIRVITLQDGRANFATKSIKLNQDKTLTKMEELPICKTSPEQEDKEATEDMKLLSEGNDEKAYQEENEIGDVDLKLYKEYIKSGGGFFRFMLVVLIYVVAQFVTSYIDKSINSWVNLEEEIANYTLTEAANATVIEEIENKRNLARYLYTGMTVTAAIVNLARSFALLIFCRTVSINLHKKVVGGLLRAPMKFFDSNYTGNILNRFSKDFSVVDETIPFVLNDVFEVFLRLTGMIVLIAYVNKIFLIPTVIILTVSILLRRYCIQTTRNLKRLETATRSSLVGYINATLEGLTTIRAFKMENQLRNEFGDHQNLQTSAYFTFHSSKAAFICVLETFCNIYVAFIIIAFLLVNESILAGDVGLAITQAFMMTKYLQFGIHQWASMENQMTSVERVYQYCEIEKENSGAVTMENWPKMGEIKYKNVDLFHKESSEPTLKNLNFVVKPNEKIAIVGRTGAGKSSIISALFRFYQIRGSIVIDDVDIKTLSVEYLRSKISVIPQDSIVFAGTIRDNIDPKRILTDEEIWNVIEVVNLKKLVPSLDFVVAKNGFNFSAGQKQLISLARAIVRKNKIVVLDEATADLDPETENVIAEIIQNNFTSCTTIIIAHKLRYVLKNCDTVIVLDRGEIIEYGSPIILTKNKNSTFNKLIQETGDPDTKHFLKI